MIDQENPRTRAVKRLKAKRDVKMHLGAYVIVNAMFVGIWALSGRGDFWPVWVLIFWGLGLAFHAWSTYFHRPFTEDQIRREMNGDR